MGKDGSRAMGGSFIQELFQFGVYKRNQGRVARQVTFIALAIVIALGAARLYYVGVTWGQDQQVFRYGLAGGLLLLGVWAAYRFVNYPRFADFLIAVEAEMNKVSWPAWPELFRASMVVLFVIVFLAALLFGYDVFWKFVFTHVIKLFPEAAAS